MVSKVLAIIPDDAAVSASAEYVPRLSGRRRIYAYPNPFYEVADIKEPLISPKANLLYPAPKNIFEFDIATKAGKELIFQF